MPDGSGGFDLDPDAVRTGAARFGPAGDETKLRELRDAWHAASQAIGPVTTNGNNAAKDTVSTWTGDSATAFAEQWKKFTEGDEAYLKSLADAAKALGDSCDQTALDV